MQENINRESRVSARIDKATKERAESVLSKHGLTISEFIRMNLTTIANEGLPPYYCYPNTETLRAIWEIVDYIKDDDKAENKASSYEELMNMLDK